MCIALTPLMIAATAVSTIGSVVGAIGQAKQANYAASIADRNAKIAAGQAADSVQNTNLEAHRRARLLAQTQGDQQAALAANGVDINFGTSLDLQRDTAMIGAEDLGQIYKAGNERTRGFDTQSGNYRAEASAQRAKASGAIVNGLFDAVGTALGGASQIAKLNAKVPKPTGPSSAFKAAFAGMGM